MVSKNLGVLADTNADSFREIHSEMTVELMANFLMQGFSIKWEVCHLHNFI